MKTPNWKIIAIERGYARTLLPLTPNASNQYIAHQAALMLLAADYTGGLALASLLHLVPIIGFFLSVDDNAGYLWGAKASIRWHAPSCHNLICQARIDKPRWEGLAKRFTKGNGPRHRQGPRRTAPSPRIRRQASEQAPRVKG